MQNRNLRDPRLFWNFWKVYFVDLTSLIIDMVYILMFYSVRFWPLRKKRYNQKIETTAVILLCWLHRHNTFCFCKSVCRVGLPSMSSNVLTGKAASMSATAVVLYCHVAILKKKKSQLLNCLCRCYNYHNYVVTNLWEHWIYWLLANAQCL